MWENIEMKDYKGGRGAVMGESLFPCGNRGDFLTLVVKGTHFP